MLILMISPQFYPIVGGYEKACERLSIALVERGHEVTIIAEQRNKTWPKSEVLFGVSVFRWWVHYKPNWHIVTSLLGLAGFLLRRGRSFDVWHVHQYGMHAAMALVLAKVLRRPVVLKLTSSSQMGISASLSSGRLPGLLAMAHRRMDAIVALTRETEAEAKAFGISPARIHVLGNGVDTRTFRPVEDTERMLLKEDLGIADAEVLIFVGRLSQEKNVSGLFQAWAKTLPRLTQRWVLVIVGDGPLRAALVEEARAIGVGDSVRFAGQQTNISGWLAAASIYVLNSFGEGLSNTMLEAMASGLPVVMSRVSGATELIEETGSGLVVPVDNCAAMAAALVELAGSEILRQEMGARGRCVIEERYAVDRVAALHEDLYSRLVSRYNENPATSKSLS